MRLWGGLTVSSVLLLLSCGGGSDDGGSGTGGASATGGKGGTSSGGTGGTSPSGGGGSTATGGTGGGGATGTCAASNKTCIPSAPLNWTGPVAYYVGAGTAPACPGAFPTKEAPQHASLDESGVSCDCKCDPATGIVCGQASWSGTFSCNVILINPNKVNSGCTSIGTQGPGIYQLGVPKPSGGTCAPKTTNALPPATWKEDAHRCVGATAGTGTDCQTGTDCYPIVPTPYKTCVWAPGDKACPTAYYSEKFLAYDSMNDTRACAECKCDTPVLSASCGDVNLTSGGCGITSTLVADGPGCKTTTASATHIDYEVTATGTCAPLGGQLTGSVTKAGEVTYCCAK